MQRRAGFTVRRGQCESRDLNPDGFPHWILSPARLPIPPLSLRFTHQQFGPGSAHRQGKAEGRRGRAQKFRAILPAGNFDTMPVDGKQPTAPHAPRSRSSKGTEPTSGLGVPSLQSAEGGPISALLVDSRRWPI